MSAIFSRVSKYTNWRKLWIALAKAEKKLGLNISDAQIEELEKNVDSLDFARVEELEKETHHDVMAHLLAYGELCPKAKGILHLGATSAFVTDNGDLLQIRGALDLLIEKTEILAEKMEELAKQYAGLATCGWTHFQPAQPTTVGKRICLWLQDLLFDLEDLKRVRADLHFLGAKGATGTQASFMILFGGDEKKVKELDQLIAKEFGFDKIFPISGQTYTRKQDVRFLAPLDGLAGTSHKCASDLRLLSHLGEMSEGRSKTQVGSSAMPHKKNPIYSERICGLARFLQNICQNATQTFATQWLERTLDDSANRRLTIPEAFLCADAILELMIKVFGNLVVDETVIEQNLEKYREELVLENKLMYAALHGIDRQKAHHSLRINPHADLGLNEKELKKAETIEIGRAKRQVEDFLTR